MKCEECDDTGFIPSIKKCSTCKGIPPTDHKFYCGACGGGSRCPNCDSNYQEQDAAPLTDE